VLAAVVSALGLAELRFDDPAVKTADAWALAQEAHRLMRSQGKTWRTADVYADCVLWPLGMQPDVARERWLDRHRALKNRWREMTSRE
jgi:hypothetical protein